jgi:hypothetical protein
LQPASLVLVVVLVVVLEPRHGYHRSASMQSRQRIARHLIENEQEDEDENGGVSGAIPLSRTRFSQGDSREGVRDQGSGA